MRYIITKKGEDVTLDCTDGDEKAEVNWAKHGGEYEIFSSINLFTLIQRMMYLIVAIPCH